MNILVTPAGETDEDDGLGRKLRSKLEQVSDRVSTLEGRNNTFHLGQHAERGESLVALLGLSILIDGRSRHGVVLKPDAAGERYNHSD